MLADLIHLGARLPPPRRGFFQSPLMEWACEWADMALRADLGVASGALVALKS